MPESEYWLLVEDNDDDYLLFRRACSKALREGPRIHRELDGLRAQAFLQKCRPLPKLVLSDLKMPRMGGLELLEWVREQPRLRGLCFIVFSTSNQAVDREAAGKLGADDYHVKPIDPTRLVDLAKELSRLDDKCAHS